MQKMKKGFTVISKCPKSKVKLPSPARISSPVTVRFKMEWQGKMAEFVEKEEDVSDTEEGLLRAMAQLYVRREKKPGPIVFFENQEYNPAQTQSSVACQCWIGVEQLAFFGPPGASMQLPSMSSPGSLMSATAYPATEQGASAPSSSVTQPMDTDEQPAAKRWKPDSMITAPEVGTAAPASDQGLPTTQDSTSAANETAPAKKIRRRWPQWRRKALAKQKAEEAAAAEEVAGKTEPPAQQPKKNTAKKSSNSPSTPSTVKKPKPGMKSVVAQKPAKGGDKQQQQQQRQPQQQQRQPQQQQQKKQWGKPKLNRQPFKNSKPDARFKINRNVEQRYPDGSFIPPMTAEEIRIRNEEARNEAWRQFRLTGVDTQAPRNTDYRLADPSFPRIVDNAALDPPVVPLGGRNSSAKQAGYLEAERVKQERARAPSFIASPREPTNYIMPPLERIVVYDPPVVHQPVPQVVQQHPQPQVLPFPEILRAMAAQMESTQKK